MGFRRDEDSSRIRLEGAFVCYAYKTNDLWRMHLDDIRIIGESTSQSGPLSDDYFICFAKDASNWMEASFYAEGRDEFLNALGARLGTELELRLANSADFASRIIWPEHLVDQPMFKYTEKVPRGAWRRLVNRILPQNLQTFSDVVLRELPKGMNAAAYVDGKPEP